MGSSRADCRRAGGLQDEREEGRIGVDGRVSTAAAGACVLERGPWILPCRLVARTGVLNEARGVDGRAVGGSGFWDWGGSGLDWFQSCCCIPYNFCVAVAVGIAAAATAVVGVTGCSHVAATVAAAAASTVGFRSRILSCGGLGISFWIPAWGTRGMNEQIEVDCILISFHSCYWYC